MTDAVKTLTSDDPIKAMKDLILGLAQALVDDKDSVQVKVRLDPSQVTFVLSVSPDELGKVIGNGGNTARSIRTILGAASKKCNLRFSLDILGKGPGL